ncbi:MAG: hypothetical protein KGS72_14850 [Cyanobacteria bacterium REEB67]|nr:hypothetical protein [Cyanobacteria bacterium REEB67]
MSANNSKSPRKVMISSRYAAAARAAADKSEGEFAAASRQANAAHLESRLKIQRAHSQRMAELQELINQAQRALRENLAASEREHDAAIAIAKRDAKAARALRLEILDKFAETGNEDEAIAQLQSLAD